jgi:hypothetical protein
MTAEGKKWLPLESNPEVLNDFVSKLGLDMATHSFSDVFGLDEVSGVRAELGAQQRRKERGRSRHRNLTAADSLPGLCLSVSCRSC